MLIKDDKEISYFIDINFNVGYIKKKRFSYSFKKKENDIILKIKVSIK